MTTLIVVDIDQTCFSTHSTIRVYRHGKHIRDLTSEEYNAYEAHEHDELDFSDFRCADTFVRNAKPILPVKKIVQEWATLNYPSRPDIIYLTARGLVDDVETFKLPFHFNNYPMFPMFFCGDSGNSAVENKKAVIEPLLRMTGHQKLVMIDDHEQNLQMAHSLKATCPRLQEVETYWVSPTHTVSPFYETLL